MTEPEYPIAEARRLLADLDGEWGYTKGRDNWDIHSEKKRGSAWVGEVFDERDAALIAAAPRLLQALCDRLEAAEREFRQSHEANCVPDYTERGLHSSWCRLYMVGTE